MMLSILIVVGMLAFVNCNQLHNIVVPLEHKIDIILSDCSQFKEVLWEYCRFGDLKGDYRSICEVNGRTADNFTCTRATMDSNNGSRCVLERETANFTHAGMYIPSDVSGDEQPSCASYVQVVGNVSCSVSNDVLTCSFNQSGLMHLINMTIILDNGRSIQCSRNSSTSNSVNVTTESCAARLLDNEHGKLSGVVQIWFGANVTNPLVANNSVNYSFVFEVDRKIGNGSHLKVIFISVGIALGAIWFAISLWRRCRAKSSVEMMKREDDDVNGRKRFDIKGSAY